MESLTMKDKWEIHNKLEEVNALITEKLYSLDNEEDKTELLKHQNEIDKILHKLVY